MARRPGTPARRKKTPNTPAEKKAAPAITPLSRLWRRLVRITAVSIVMSIILAVAVVLWYAHDLPDPRKIAKVTRTPTVALLDSTGEVFARFGGVAGDHVSVDEMPPWLTAAVIAVEDRRFYHHGGVDVRGVLRAAFRNLREGRVREGGSTLTQQLAKNLFLTHQRSFKRKIQEVLLAIWLEQNLSKDEILTLYLNRVYFGAGAYGVDAAARRYFAKPAAAVTLGEAAMLAGLLKAPSRYAPTVNPRGARDRAATVLAAMAASGMLDEQQATAARAQAVKVVKQPVRRQGQYFADWVRDQLPDYIGASESTSLVVGTTLDAKLQAAAETAVSEVLTAIEPDRRVGQVALIAMTGDGAVRAMVGGRSYRASTYNRAVTAMRQPGSAFKLFVYLAALENGITPASRFVDQPINVNGWRPRNYSGRFEGAMAVRDAFARSINTIAVRISESVGRRRVIETARRLGITSELPPHPSIALGAVEVTLIELTAAFTAIANGGTGVWPYAIVEVGNEGARALYQRRGTGPGRVLKVIHARQMTELLRAVVGEGTGRAAELNIPAAGKTGTSQDNRDAWFVGFAGELVVGVWVGNDDASPMRGVTGGGLPAQIWRRFMVLAQPAPAAIAPQRPQPEQEPAKPSLWQRLEEMLYQENR